MLLHKLSFIARENVFDCPVNSYLKGSDNLCFNLSNDHSNELEDLRPVPNEGQHRRSSIKKTPQCLTAVGCLSNISKDSHSEGVRPNSRWGGEVENAGVDPVTSRHLQLERGCFIGL